MLACNHVSKSTRVSGGKEPNVGEKLHEPGNR